MSNPAEPKKPKNQKPKREASTPIYFYDPTLGSIKVMEEAGKVMAEAEAEEAKIWRFRYLDVGGQLHGFVGVKKRKYEPTQL